MDGSPENLRAAREQGYETPRPDVLAHVPTEASNILELGCSTGALGASIKQRQNARILGIEVNSAYASEAERRLDRVVVADAQAFIAGEPPPEAPFDCLIAADVLEHLVDPWMVLKGTASLLSAGATVVVSLPNVLYYAGWWRIVRWRRWPRDPEGVFDATHLRWFSLRDAQDLLRNAGLEPEVVDPRYWVEGNQLRWREFLAQTPLMPFLAPQYVLTAKRGA